MDPAALRHDFCGYRRCICLRLQPALEPDSKGRHAIYKIEEDYFGLLSSSSSHVEHTGLILVQL